MTPLVLDTHIDIRWPETPDWLSETNQCVDLPKMRRGGMSGAVFIAYVGQGARDLAGHAAASARAEAMLRHIRARADGVASRFCATPDELEASFAAGIPAVLSAVENGYAMGHDLARIAAWRRLGAIYLTLTHDGHNALADSARPRKNLNDAEKEHGGLSALGRAAIAEMNRVGLMLDCSHVSKAGMMQAAELSRTPIAVTHTACAALCAHPRNLDDEQLDMIRAVGGVAQITAVASFLKAPGANGVTQASVADLVDHVEHAIRRIGLDHVGISSDFDGGGSVAGWSSAAETQNITAELEKRGYGPREIGLLWSGNFLRVWRQVLRAAA
ncbi:dipeptidase [Roseococcus sp. SDR]|uniref:dipeptidase n=1 Tax=Roseococcus sp. SDR TaxID=2835532 RepID=UPI001BD0BF09|nr:membrane dipeptidase [Roseococcus sp. SDR]MBS7789960.1 dipeptidase [Roseococcus sp. SDR]MBV1845274.1 dipeptidase [Roseococcus sp. SDR]